MLVTDVGDQHHCHLFNLFRLTVTLAALTSASHHSAQIYVYQNFDFRSTSGPKMFKNLMLDLCAYNQKPWNEISGGFLRKKFGYEPVKYAGSRCWLRKTMRKGDCEVLNYATRFIFIHNYNL